MPTYEYRCTNGHDFEEFVLKMSAAKSELPCPTCGERGARRMSAGGGLLFKGSGFYITDYGKDGKKAQATSLPAAKGDGAKSDGAANASAKSDGGNGAGSTSDAPKAEAKPVDTKPAASSSAPPAPKGE